MIGLKRRELVGGLVGMVPLMGWTQMPTMASAPIQGVPATTGAVKNMAIDPANVKPYVQLQRPIAEDARRVLSFFSFTCPYCRDAHDMLSNWAIGLPPNWLTHEWIPTVVDQESMAAAAAFFAASRRLTAGKSPRAAAKDLAIWMKKAYAFAPETRGLPPSQHLAAWAHLAGDGKWMNLVAQRDNVLHSGERLVRYGVNATPSVAMGGRYVITPEITAGKPDLFIKLANGVASMVLTEMGYQE